MKIIAVGLNHKTAPVEIREKLSIPERDLPASLEAIGGNSPLWERLILSTCNRTEVYGVAHDWQEARSTLEGFLARRGRIPVETLRGFLYCHVEEAAVRHLSRVAAGLDSMILGESQILAQVKKAYQLAQEWRATGPILNALSEHALKVGKRVRTETGIGASATSIPGVAVELARRIFGKLEGKIVLIIGAGEMAELATRHLLEEQVSAILVANRNAERAIRLANELGGRVVRFERLQEELAQVDIVISSTASPHYLLRKADLVGVMRQRRNRPLFIIDIAVPRDIDPEVHDLDGLYLYDIDDLKGVAELNRTAREKEARRAEAIVEKEVALFMARLRSLHAVPTIVQLREWVETIRAAELEKAFSKLSHLRPEDREAIASLTAALVNKILHRPIVELKRRALEGDGHAYCQAVAELFGLEAKESPSRTGRCRDEA